MSYKTIIVHLDDEKRARHLLDKAVPLARKLDAHLIGLAIVPPYVIMPGGEVYGGAVTLDEHRQKHRVVMGRLKQGFDEITASLGLAREWREVDAGFRTVNATLVECARAVDLVMISHAPGRRYENDAFAEEVDLLVMELGCPVALIPEASTSQLPPRLVTVAWNGRREALRAVTSALPLLKLAEEVNIVSLNAEDEFGGPTDVAGAELAKMLARHGVTCVTSQASAPKSEVGSELLRLASGFGSDLLVMGCYGHSRLREFILGGASRDVLRAANIALLMTH